MLLRGDMDALPLVEDTGLPFTSGTHGAMHACGHDTHVAMLAGAARALCERRERLTGSVMFMFQPGEEGWHGARHMIDDGLLDPNAGRRLRPAHLAQHATGVFAGRDRAAAGLVRQDLRPRGGRRRPRLHAARRARPDPGAVRDRHGLQTLVTRRIRSSTRR